MALTPATLEPIKPQVLHPRLAELWLIRCQTSLNSLIYGANFGNYVRVPPILSEAAGLLHLHPSGSRRENSEGIGSNTRKAT